MKTRHWQHLPFWNWRQHLESNAEVLSSPAIGALIPVSISQTILYEIKDQIERCCTLHCTFGIFGIFEHWSFRFSFEFKTLLLLCSGYDFSPYLSFSPMNIINPSQFFTSSSAVLNITTAIFCHQLFFHITSPGWGALQITNNKKN